MKIKYIWLGALALTTSSWAEPVYTPDPEYDKILSSSPMASPSTLKAQARIAPKARVSGNLMSIQASKPTYTYLRCYYRVEDTPSNTRTAYVWATEGDSWYHVNGYWAKSSTFSPVMDMFYTNTSQAELAQKCYATLTQQNKSTSSLMYYAANNQFSYNHETWNNNLDNIDNRKINRIIAFGDSLSDTQTMYNVSQWHIPNNTNYVLGRFTNGSNWLEYLAKDFNYPINNWAVGGAAGNTVKSVFPGVQQQISSWIFYMQQAKNYNPEHTLVTLWIGSNDLMRYNRSADQVIDDINYSLTQLTAHGIKHILVLNLPDLTQTPLIMNKIKKDIDYNLLAAQVNYFNARLSALVELKQDDGVSLFDVHSLMNMMLTDPKVYGFDKVNQSCLEIDTDVPFSYAQSNPLRKECQDPNTYVFWDTLHPTTRSHRIVADEVTKFIKSNYDL